MSLATIVTPCYEYTNGMKAIFWLPPDKIANKQQNKNITLHFHLQQVGLTPYKLETSIDTNSNKCGGGIEVNFWLQQEPKESCVRASEIFLK